MSEQPTAGQLADALIERTCSGQARKDGWAVDRDCTEQCHKCGVLVQAAAMLRNTIGHQEVLDEAAKDVVRLQAEIERLRAALRTIVKRAEGGAGAAVMVTPHLLAAIAKGALGDE